MIASIASWRRTRHQSRQERLLDILECFWVAFLVSPPRGAFALLDDYTGPRHTVTVGRLPPGPGA
jgi:hypothetical protein